MTIGASAQSAKAQAKMQEKAKERTEKLSTMIKTVSPDDTFTEEQSTKIAELYYQKALEVRAVKQGEGTDAEHKVKTKELNKKYNGSINSILTEEQAKARRQAAKAAREAKQG